MDFNAILSSVRRYAGVNTKVKVWERMEDLNITLWPQIWWLLTTGFRVMSYERQKWHILWLPRSPQSTRGAGLPILPRSVTGRFVDRRFVDRHLVVSLTGLFYSSGCYWSTGCFVDWTFSRKVIWSKGCFVDWRLVENCSFVHNCMSNRPNCCLITCYTKINY